MKNVRFSNQAREDKNLESAGADCLPRREKTTLHKPEGAHFSWVLGPFLQQPSQQRAATHSHPWSPSQQAEQSAADTAPVHTTASSKTTPTAGPTPTNLSNKSEVKKTRSDGMKRVMFYDPAGEDKDLESTGADCLPRKEMTILHEPEGAGICWVLGPFPKQPSQQRALPHAHPWSPSHQAEQSAADTAPVHTTASSKTTSSAGPTPMNLSMESEVDKTTPDGMRSVRFSNPAGEDKDLELSEYDFLPMKEKPILHEPEGLGVCWTVAFRIYLVCSLGFALTYLLFVMLVGPGRTWDLLEHFVNIST